MYTVYMCINFRQKEKMFALLAVANSHIMWTVAQKVCEGNIADHRLLTPGLQYRIYVTQKVFIRRGEYLEFKKKESNMIYLFIKSANSRDEQKAVQTMLLVSLSMSFWILCHFPLCHHNADLCNPAKLEQELICLLSLHSLQKQLGYHSYHGT
jgi:hypothetical protein